MLTLRTAWEPRPLGSTFASAARRAIASLDDHLSRRQGVVVFSDRPECILRYAPAFADRSFSLSDGVKIAIGDRIVDIHCWNERVPRMPPGGPDLLWAQQTSRGLRSSLRLLAEALVSTPDLHAVRACRARVTFVGQGGSNASVTRIIHRHGFEDVIEGEASLASRVHDTMENLLIASLVWAHNPAALRRDKMMRERRPVWASREALLRLYGPRATVDAQSDSPR